MKNGGGKHWSEDNKLTPTAASAIRMHTPMGHLHHTQVELSSIDHLEQSDLQESQCNNTLDVDGVVG